MASSGVGKRRAPTASLLQLPDELWLLIAMGYLPEDKSGTMDVLTLGKTCKGFNNEDQRRSVVHPNGTVTLGPDHDASEWSIVEKILLARAKRRGVLPSWGKATCGDPLTRKSSLWR